MPLSEHEQRVLEQLERQLTSDDPKLASALHGRASSPVRTWLLAGLGGLAGLGMLLGGVAGGLPWLGVLGFATMLGSVLLAVSKPRRRGPKGVVAEDGSTTPKRGASRTGFLTRLEERWERRRREQR